MIFTCLQGNNWRMTILINIYANRITSIRPNGKSKNKLNVRFRVLQLVDGSVHAKPVLLCPTLCNRMDCSLPGSTVHGILQARILKWVAMPSSRGSFQPRDPTRISCIIGGFIAHWAISGNHKTRYTLILLEASVIIIREKLLMTLSNIYGVKF